MMASTTFHSVSMRPTPRVSLFLLGIETNIVHPNYRRISLVIHIYWTMSTSCIHLPGLGRGGGCSLSQIGFMEPHIEVLCAEVGVAACLVVEKASDCCLHLRLRWDLIINLERVNVGSQWSSRGVRFLLLVQGSIVLCDIIHIGPGSVGKSGERLWYRRLRPCGDPYIPLPAQGMP